MSESCKAPDIHSAGANKMLNEQGVVMLNFSRLSIIIFLGSILFFPKVLTYASADEPKARAIMEKVENSSGPILSRPLGTRTLGDLIRFKEVDEEN